MAEQRYSGNGWPAYATTANYVLFTAANQRWWAANSDVAVVFTEVITRFDKEIEPIAGPVLDDWSYANRLVRGSTSVVSNHGSATAIDLNALKHGRGIRNTFTPVKAAKFRAIKNSITDARGFPVLRLGMDYVSVVDDMHVEIHANAARVKEAANKIRARNALVKEDIVASIAQLRAEIIDVLETEPLVANKILDRGDKQGGDWTFSGVLAANDQKMDYTRRTQNEHTATLQSHSIALAAQAAAIKALDTKLDKILALISPPPPVVTKPPTP